MDARKRALLYSSAAPVRIIGIEVNSDLLAKSGCGEQEARTLAEKTLRAALEQRAVNDSARNWRTGRQRMTRS